MRNPHTRETLEGNRFTARDPMILAIQAITAQKVIYEESFPIWPYFIN